MPELSVLLPVRNGAATLRHALTSTLRAMPRDSELVVWDDASTDETTEVVQTVRDRRLRVIAGERSLGVGAALRALADRTDSRHVARMDADDVCLPWRFALQSAALRRGGRDILFSPVVRFRTSPLRIEPSAPVSIPPAAFPLHLAVMNIAMHPTMYALRGSLERAGGYRDVIAEDYDLWLRAGGAGLRMARTAVPALAYRRHGAQVSLTGDYSRQVASDPVIAQSYRDFVRATLDVDIAWMPGRPSGSPEAREDARVLRERLEHRASALPRLQRRLLLRTMRRLPG